MAPTASAFRLVGIMKRIYRARWFAIMAIFMALGACPSVQSSELASLQVRGRIVDASGSAQCLVQLRNPGPIPVIEDKEVWRDFSLQLTYPSAEGGVLVEITCDGYRVYASRPIASDEHLLDVGVIDAAKRLDTDGCRELTGAKGELATHELLSIFISEVKLSRDKMGVSRPKECEDRIYLFVEALDEFSGPGQHWIVEKTKKDGKITVDQGI